MRALGLAALVVAALSACARTGESQDPAAGSDHASADAHSIGAAGLTGSSPNDPLSPEVEARTTAALRRQLHEAGGGAVDVEVLFAPNTPDAVAVAAVQRAGATVLEQRQRFGGVLYARGDIGAISALASAPSVVVISDVPPPATTWLDPRAAGGKEGALPSNADSLDTSNADEVGPGGAAGLSLTGEGVLLGVIDEGPIRTSHVDFGSRARYLDAAGEFSSHATHVSGTMIGAGVGRRDAAGFAPAGRVLGWTFSRDTIDLMSRVNFRLSASNHSYGYDLGWDRNGRWVGDEGFGKYTLDARRADEAIRLFDVIWVKAAGNDRGQGAERATEARPADCSTGIDCIEGAGVAKNMLTIAATRDLSVDPIPVGGASATGFSSRGPADDGRVKPDLAANGDSLLSTAHTGDDAYVRLSGTSMAAPSVTGGIALVIEHYRNVLGRDPDAAELRALLIHTATWNDAQGRPDQGLGWGLMNVRAAVDLVGTHAGSRRVVHGVYTGAPLSLTVTPAPGEPVGLTLAWLDPPGAVNTRGRNDATPALVNDLDLRASHGGATWYPWRFSAADRAAVAVADGPNRVDNVERIVIPGASVGAGAVTLTIDHQGTIDGGSQAFVLVSSHPVRPASEVPLFGAQRVIRVRAANDAAPFDLSVPMRLVAGSGASWRAEAVDAPFWLTVTDGEGRLPEDGADLRIDPRGLSPSLHFATLRLINESTPAAPPRYVTVMLDVRGLEYPEVDAGPNLRVPTGATVALRGSGRDPAGDPVTLRWSQVAGPTVTLDDRAAARPRFTAPPVGSDTVLRFTLVASNGALESAPDAVEVTVFPTAGANEPADNRCATAPLVPLPYSGGGVLEPRHDVDFVRIALGAGETVTARTFRRGAAIDTMLGATTLDGRVLATDDDSGVDLYSTLTWSAPGPGEHCIAVSVYPDASFDGADAGSGGEYGLTIEVDRPNVAPIADAGADAEVDGGAVGTLDGTGSVDPDGFTLGYSWTQTSGPVVELSGADSPRPRFFAPVVAEPAVLGFSLEVFDADGARSADEVSVRVRAVARSTPTADAGGARVVPEGATVSLVGRARAVAGEELELAWEQVSGPGVALSGASTATVGFVAPSVDEPTELELSLTVTGAGSSDSDRAVVRVIPTSGPGEPDDNRCDTAPLLGRSALVPVDVSVAGELAPQHDVDHYRVAVLEGSALDFRVGQNGPRIDTTMGLFRRVDGVWSLVATDDDGGGGTYSRIRGESAAAGELCVAVSHFRDLSFDGAAADGAGPYLLTVVVMPPDGANQPPVADAGPDLTVDPGALVSLDGTSSLDPEGEALDYAWRLVSGPRTVAVFDPLSASAQVIVPNDLPEAGEFVFELRVSDGAFEDAATTTVRVGPNRRPRLEPVPRFEVDLGEDVAFTVSAVDPDGDAVRYVAEELPSGASFDAGAGRFSWRADRGGYFTPRIEAVDPYGAFDELFVPIVVVDRASENRAPVVSPIADVLVETEDAPVTVRLSVSASDPDGDALTYFWQLSDLSFLGADTTIEATFGFGRHRVECFVSDGEATSRVSLTVTVRSTAPGLPVADAGYDQTLRALEDGDVPPVIALDGRGSHDPEERGALRFEWTQTAGPALEVFGATSRIPSFEQPVGDGVLRFELVVELGSGDGVVRSTPDEVVVVLSTDEPNARPGALIEGPGRATAGAVLQYDASRSEDPDGDVLEFFWSLEQGAGSLSSDREPGVEVSFGLPDAELDEWELALLTWDGLAYSRPVRRTIVAEGSRANREPTAVATLVGSPRVGAGVQLDASDSDDPDGDDLRFAWSQVGGPVQELVGGDRPVADVVLRGAPGEVVEFEVAVSDGSLVGRATLAFALLPGTGGEDAGADVGGGDAGGDADGVGGRGRRSSGGCGVAVEASAPWASCLAGLVCALLAGRGRRAGAFAVSARAAASIATGPPSA